MLNTRYFRQRSATKATTQENFWQPQPRRTTRDKYKQEAGFRPVMVHVIKKPDLAFHKNDVVPYKGADGTINYFFVTTDIKQKDYVSQQSWNLSTRITEMNLHKHLASKLGRKLVQKGAVYSLILRRVFSLCTQAIQKTEKFLFRETFIST